MTATATSAGEADGASPGDGDDGGDSVGTGGTDGMLPGSGGAQGEPVESPPYGLAPEVDDPTVTLRIRHVETGDVFDAVGRSLEENTVGDLGDSPLQPLPGYNQFWFAWSVFNNGSDLFNQSAPVATEDFISEPECAVPCDDIQFGCPGKDCIPALSDPLFVTPDDEKADYLPDNAYVVGVAEGGEARAYPHNILWWHEIVNDTVGGVPIAVTHCPLTFSSLGHDPTRFIEGETVELGVSGKLFNSNLVFYNRADDTYFSQLLGVGTMGDGLNDEAPRVHVWEMTWGAWKALFPDTTVMSGDPADTGHARDYQRYPYGDYFEDHETTFRTTSPLPDPVYDNKQLTYGLRLGSGSKAWVHDELGEWAEETYGEGVREGVLMDQVGGQDVVVVFDLDAVYVQAFLAPPGSTWELAE